MKNFLSFLAVILAGAVLAEKQPLSRYQSIIDRRPFGQPPPGYDPDSTSLEAGAGAAAMTQEELTQEQEQLQRSVSFTVMNINTDGSVSVGFSDLSDPKSPAHYYLREGESSNDWLVKSVDVHEQMLVLDKDGIEISLHLGDVAKKDQKGGDRAGRRQAHGGRSMLLGGRGPGGDGDNSPMSFTSRRMRRAQEAAALEKQRADQEAERKRLAEESEAKAAEEKAAREEERAATRRQLQAIQEELRRAREEKARRQEQEPEQEGDENANDES